MKNTVTVKMPVKMLLKSQAKAAKDGHATYSNYIAALILRDCKRA